jgi:hypothetical protein
VHDEVDQLDADEGQDHAAEPVDEQVASQECGGADRAVLDAAERERDERLTTGKGVELLVPLTSKGRSGERTLAQASDLGQVGVRR